MILSHKHRFIFIKTSKTAGTSLEIALSKYCGPDDIITPISAIDEQTRRKLGHRGPQQYLKPYGEYGLADYFQLLRKRRRVLKFYNHISAADVRKAIGADVWDGYFKFSIVRNPFDWAVSRYFWRNRRGRVSRDHFRAFLFKDPTALVRNRKRTQIDNRPVIDFMIRFEHLEADLNVLAQRLGLPAALYSEFKSLGAKKGHRPPGSSARDMFADFDEGIALIMKICGDDIQAFGYRPPWIASEPVHEQTVQAR